MGMVDEFKEFISKGNVMDMAVGVIIGGTFTGIVTSLTDDVIQPIIQLIGGGELGGDWMVPGTQINIGAFVSAIINFLIISLVVFSLVKSLNKIQEAATALVKKEADDAAAAAAAAPTCPFCLEEVKEGATRCPHCGGAFDSPALSK